MAKIQFFRLTLSSDSSQIDASLALFSPTDRHSERQTRMKYLRAFGAFYGKAELCGENPPFIRSLSGPVRQDSFTVRQRMTGIAHHLFGSVRRRRPDPTSADRLSGTIVADVRRPTVRICSSAVRTHQPSGLVHRPSANVRTRRPPTVRTRPPFQLQNSQTCANF